MHKHLSTINPSNKVFFKNTCNIITGDKGDRGLTGFSGIPGKDGSKGADGYSGPHGIPGRKGEKVNIDFFIRKK